MEDEIQFRILDLVHKQGGFYGGHNSLFGDREGIKRKELNNCICRAYKKIYKEELDIMRLSIFWKLGLFRKGALGYDVFLSRKGFALYLKLEKEKEAKDDENI